MLNSKINNMSASNFQKSRKEKLEYMPKDEKSKFLSLLHVQSNANNEKQMLVYIIDRLNEINNIQYEIDDIGNLLVTKGNTETFPCIVAHMDTVHDFKSQYTMKIMERNNRELVYGYATSFEKCVRVGTGGDDKCGIYATIKMLQEFNNMKAVFFTQEETGLIGSGEINHDFFDNVGYIIQLDRWGRSDFICKDMGDHTVSEDFIYNSLNVRLEYGYNITEGLITDSINLYQDYVGVSCINVSCGYYLHHTPKEYIDLNEFWNSLKFTKQLIHVLDEKKYECFPTYTSYYDSWNGSWNDDWKENDHEELNEKEKFETSYIEYTIINELEFQAGIELWNLDDVQLIDFLTEFNDKCHNEGLPTVNLGEFKERIDEYYYSERINEYYYSL